MRYDDEARRFNYFGGLTLGLVIGAAMTLLARPRQRLGRPHRIRDSARHLRSTAVGSGDRLREAIRPAADALAAVAARGHFSD